MKIGVVGYKNLNCIQGNNSMLVSTPKPTSDVQQQARPSLGYISYPLSFTSNANLTNTGRFIFLKLHNLPCPCCGKIMIPPSVYNSKLTPEILSGTSRQAVRALSEFKENMHSVEKACFEKIKGASVQNPTRTLQEILIDFRPTSLKSLRNNQFKVLNKIDTLGKDLSLDSMSKLSELTNEARKLITEDVPDSPFKRKVFIRKVFQLIEEFPEKTLGEDIYSEAFSLDNSENDLNAFIVKYSQRTSREIGQRLVSPSVTTIEHIKPRNPGESGIGKGPSSAKNYLAECAKCNNTRGNTLLSNWVLIKPEMPANTKKHLAIIIDLINKGKVKSYNSYPTDVAETLYVQSKGKIDLVSWVESKLKVSEDFNIEELKNRLDTKENLPKRTGKNKSVVIPEAVLTAFDSVEASQVQEPKIKQKLNFADITSVFKKVKALNVKKSTGGLSSKEVKKKVRDMNAARAKMAKSNR